MVHSYKQDSGSTEMDDMLSLNNAMRKLAASWKRAGTWIWPKQRYQTLLPQADLHNGQKWKSLTYATAEGRTATWYGWEAPPMLPYPPNGRPDVLHGPTLIVKKQGRGLLRRKDYSLRGTLLIPKDKGLLFSLPFLSLTLHNFPNCSTLSTWGWLKWTQWRNQ